MTGRGGFTILETLVAAALLSLVVVALFTLYPTSLLAVHRGEHAIEANSVAQSIVEHYRTISFGQLRALAPPLGGGSATIPLDPPATSDDGTNYHRSVTFFRIPGHDADPIRIIGIRARVDWQERDRPMHISQELWFSEIKQ